jgi:CysZ protein
MPERGLLMLRDALAAFEQILSPPFRSVLWKSLALSLALLVLGYLALAKLASGQIVTPWSWLDTWIAIALGFGLFIGMAFLVAPVSALVAGFFLDDLAEIVERQISPDHLGRAMPNAQAIWLATKFAALSLLINFIALILLLLPGINLLAFLGANAYLLGREYFELAALRYRPLEDVRVLRARHGTYLFFCGLLIALLVSIPGLNLLTPLFGTAFMVRVHQRIAPPSLIEHQASL